MFYWRGKILGASKQQRNPKPHFLKVVRTSKVTSISVWSRGELGLISAVYGIVMSVWMVWLVRPLVVTRYNAHVSVSWHPGFQSTKITQQTRSHYSSQATEYKTHHWQYESHSMENRDTNNNYKRRYREVKILDWWQVNDRREPMRHVRRLIT